MKSAQSAPRLTWTDLSTDYLDHLITSALLEDIGGLGLKKRPRIAIDRSTASLANTPKNATAHLVARTNLTLCGIQLIPRILAAYTPPKQKAPTIKFHARDSQQLRPGQKIATLTGNPLILLPAERVLLNFLQHLSGISTQTRRYIDALGKTKTKLLDTRKTTPAYRMLEKYAVACGGAHNHRLGLFDRVMLKDNHLALLNFSPEKTKNKTGTSTTTALAAAVRTAKKTRLPVEVEVDNLAQIPPVLDAGADIILLDNFPPAQIKRALKLIGTRAQTEASGGITLQNIKSYAKLGLTYISTGALVHQSTWTDIALDWQ